MCLPLWECPMETLRGYSDDIREELTSTGLSDDDIQKMDKAFIPEFINQQGRELGITESELTTALEAFDQLDDQSFESFHIDEDIFPTFGMEGFKDRALAIIDAFISWLKRFFKWVYETLDTVSINAKFKREKFRQIKFDLRRRSVVSGGRFLLSRNVSSVCVFYKPLPDVGKVVGAMTTYQNVVNGFYNHIGSIVDSGRINRILSEIGAGDHMSQSLADSVATVSPLALETKLSMKQAPDVTDGWMTRPLLGNTRLLLKKPNDIATIRQLSTVEFTLARVTTVPQRIPESIHFPHFDRRQAEALVDKAIAIMDVVIEATDGKSRRSLGKMVNDIDAMTQRLRRDYQTYGGESLHQRLQLTRRMVEWFNQPYRSLAINATRTIGGLSHLCYRNFAG